jgi:hypothetical protein
MFLLGPLLAVEDTASGNWAGHCHMQLDTANTNVEKNFNFKLSSVLKYENMNMNASTSDYFCPRHYIHF